MRQPVFDAVEKYDDVGLEIPLPRRKQGSRNSANWFFFIGEGRIFRCFAVCTPVCSMMACSRISANSVAEPSLVRILLANWFECRYRPDIWIYNDDRYEARSRASGSRVSCALIRESDVRVLLQCSPWIVEVSR